MKKLVCSLIVAAFAWSAPAFPTGLATCDSGSEDTWRSQDELKKRLVEQGWEVRRIKVDGGCYEVYALDDKGEPVEAYFHPQTLDPVPIDEEK
jgi:hypothetical protein